LGAVSLSRGRRRPAVLLQYAGLFANLLRRFGLRTVLEAQPAQQLLKVFAPDLSVLPGALAANHVGTVLVIYHGDKPEPGWTLAAQQLPLGDAARAVAHGARDAEVRLLFADSRSELVIF